MGFCQPALLRQQHQFPENFALGDAGFEHPRELAVEEFLGGERRIPDNHLTAGIRRGLDVRQGREEKLSRKLGLPSKYEKWESRGAFEQATGKVAEVLVPTERQRQPRRQARRQAFWSATRFKNGHDRIGTCLPTVPRHAKIDRHPVF